LGAGYGYRLARQFRISQLPPSRADISRKAAAWTRLRRINGVDFTRSANLGADLRRPARRRPMSERNGGLSKGDFYRISRMLHGYLSAAAFLILLLFAVTGVLLNHPEWEWATRQTEQTFVEQLSPAELAAAKAAPEPPKALAEALSAKRRFIGGFSTGDVFDGQALIRMAGPKGSSEISVDLATGEASIRETRSATIALMNELHRGRDSGVVWRAVIDVSAIVIALLSIIGYVLFFSLRFRVKTALVLTGLSLVGMIATVVWLVP
jgi:hypothetical protein